MQNGGALISHNIDMIPAAPDFIPGLTLNRRFYWEVVRPLLDKHMPGLRHSAGLAGYGSDVLGYDTPMSTDHNWGPRLHLYLSPEDFERRRSPLDELLRARLPGDFAGYPVHFSTPDLEDNGVQRGETHQGGPVNHLLSITTVEHLFHEYLAISPDAELSAYDWLLLPEQKLLEVTSGDVFHDGLETLHAARAKFAYYPDDIWKLRLAAQWQRISEEEAFVGRTGDLGDNVGSWIIAARLARDLIRLGFLYARRYAPYSKWLGTAFVRLPLAASLMPHLQALTTAAEWRDREIHLCALYTKLAEIHNALGITVPLTTATRNYFGRPYQVLFAGRFAEAIGKSISHPALRELIEIGAVDQFSDCVAIHSNALLAAKLKSIYS
jgi:hypothetical protein